MRGFSIGKYKGRKPVEIDNLSLICENWIKGEITGTQAAELMKVCRTTAYKKLKQYKELKDSEQEGKMRKRKYNSFSKKTFGDMISSNISLEDTEMLSRVHFYNTIYLYGVFENSVAQDIVSRNTARSPLYLYETPKTAYMMAGDKLQKPVILRFAVNIAMSEKLLAYDGLIVETKDIINKTHLKKEEYMKKCNYIREIKTVHRNFQVIQYKIQNINIIENVQHI